MNAGRLSSSLDLRVAGVLGLTLGLFAVLVHPPWGTSWGVVPALGVCIVLGAVSLHLLVGRRVRQLDHAMQAVMEGDLDGRLPPPSPDAIGRLTANVGRMIGSLRSSYDELKNHDDLRRKMVANVSHELRTPLTSIQGYLETARLAGPDSPDFAANLDVCLRETRKLSRLVQDLFELSKLDAGRLDFHFETVSLVEIADQVGLAFEQRMADKQIEFETHFPEDPLELVGDGNRLGQVVQNLLGNAAVFTGPGGKVTMTCSREGSGLLLEVADTGVGIAARDLPHVFDSFFHAEKSRTRNLGGTGLGLAICKAVVEAHGGTISVRSQPGEGAAFQVALPPGGPGGQRVQL